MIVIILNDSDTACWEFNPGQWTYSYTPLGDSWISNIYEAINNCTELGFDHCGAVLFDEINGFRLRSEASLQGEPNSSSSIGSWIRNDGLRSQC